MITPNQLTALRIVVACANPIILLSYRSFVGDVLVILTFTFACVTDWWDGYLARTKGLVTRAGMVSDPIADKLSILGLLLSFCILSLYSFEWIVPIFLRELAVTWARLRRLRKGEVIPAEWAGKLKVGFQIGSVYASLVLLAVLDSGRILKMPHSILPLFQGLHYLGIILANILTVISGALFFHRLNQT